jgi:molybdate transport system ATP-binding protein
VLASPATRFAAAVAGLNRVEGRTDAAAWRAGNLVLPRPAGTRHPSSAAVFRPSDVRVAEGPPRGAGEWIARIVRLEQTPAGVRVRTADPDVAVDVAADRAAGLGPGDPITLRVDPADVRFVDVP